MTGQAELIERRQDDQPVESRRLIRNLIEARYRLPEWLLLASKKWQHQETSSRNCQRALEEGPRWGASKGAGE